MAAIDQLKNLTVDEYTTPVPITVEQTTSISEVMNLMQEHQIRHVPVLSEQKVVGIISERDVVAFGNNPQFSQLEVKEIMTPGPKTVSSTTTLDAVAFEMSSSKVGSLLITDEKGNLSGIFTTSDALNALIEIIRGDVEL